MKKHKTIIILIIALIAVLLFSAGIWWWSDQQEKKEALQQEYNIREALKQEYDIQVQQFNSIKIQNDQQINSIDRETDIERKVDKMIAYLKWTTNAEKELKAQKIYIDLNYEQLKKIELNLEDQRNNLIILLNSIELNKNDFEYLFDFNSEFVSELDAFVKLAKQHDALLEVAKQSSGQQRYASVKKYIQWVDDNEIKFYQFRTFVEFHYKEIEQSGNNPDYLVRNIQETIDIMKENRKKFIMILPFLSP